MVDHIDFAFVVLCPDRSLAGLKNTLGSIRHFSSDRESLAIVGKDANSADMKEFKTLCPTHKGKDTITSLVNVGMKKLKHEWGLMLFGGSRIPMTLERKLRTFLVGQKDVLYPVVDRRCDFVSGSFNGVLINKEFFDEVGNFPESAMVKEDFNDFEAAKLFWSLDAIGKGATFKGIVGMKII
jgi:hypothetical protein